MALLPIGKGQISLNDVQEEINRLLDRVWHGGVATGPLDGQEWAPLIDVLAESDRFVIHAEVPGLETNDVEVSLSENILTLKGHKSFDRVEGEDRSYLRRERPSGSFFRSITLPAKVESDAVTAVCRQGVLEIVLPKSSEAVARSIEVRGED